MCIERIGVEWFVRHLDPPTGDEACCKKAVEVNR